MIHYDSKVLYEFAERLYKRAAGIIIRYGIIGAVGGAIAGMILASLATADENFSALVGAVGGALLGVVIAAERGFTLRLQAQTLLCSVAIEENSRRVAERG